MDEEFPDLDLCWNGKSTNILLVTEETYQALSQNLTPQTFSLQFHVDSEQENALKARFKEMIRKQNMKFQSEGGYPENLNLFQITCKSDLLRREQNYIQTSRLFLLVISGCLIFIGIMNFLNARVTEILIRKKRMYSSGKCGNDEKAVISYVFVRRHCYLDGTECSAINRWYNIALWDWMVYENKDFLFCFFLSNQRNGCSTDDFTCRQYSGTRNLI